MSNDNVDGGDALFAVAAEITGEASMLRYYASSDVPSGIKGRTEALVSKLSAAIDAGADRIFDAKIEAALRTWLPIVGGAQTVRADVAPVVREIRGEVGDRFERTGESCTGCMFHVVEILESGTRALTSPGTGHQWRADLDMLRDPSLFRFISSAAERAASNPALTAAVLGPAVNNKANVCDVFKTGTTDLGYSLWTVVQVDAATRRIMSGSVSRWVPAGELTDATGVWTRVYVNVPAEMAVAGTSEEDEAPGVKMGDKFTRANGANQGRVATVNRFDEDGDAWLFWADRGELCAGVDSLLDASEWTRVIAPEEVVSDDGSDPDAPVGNLRTAAELLTETDTAIADLIRVWHAFRTDMNTYPDDVQKTMTVLAKCAGLPVPWMRPE